jgi:hypothetical protein
MNVTVEILRWADAQNPEVLHTVNHRCHSLDTVIATAQSVIGAPELPANGYRIITDDGVEIYGWPE